MSLVMLLTLAASQPPDALLGGIGTCVAAAVAYTAHRRGVRLAQDAGRTAARREPIELAELAQDAAAKAVESVRAALEESEERYTQVRDELRVVSGKLDATKAELHAAIESREQMRLDLAARDGVIQELRAEVGRLRGRVQELESRMATRAETEARSTVAPPPQGG